MDRPRRRKLLAASVGIAAVSYVVGVACEDSGVTSGNLPAPTPSDASQTTDGPKINDAANEQVVISGNLPAPPPPDAGDAGDAGDASDAD